MSTKFKIGGIVGYTGDDLLLRGKTFRIVRPYFGFDGYDCQEVNDSFALYTIEAKLLFAMPNSGYEIPVPTESELDSYRYVTSGIGFSRPNAIVNPIYKLTCECGISKVHGDNVASDMHSSYCPLYRKES